MAEEMVQLKDGYFLAFRDSAKIFEKLSVQPFENFPPKLLKNKLSIL
jgi:hypothetical protein